METPAGSVVEVGPEPVDNGTVNVGTGRATVALAALSVGSFSFVTTELLPVGLLPEIGRDLDRTLPQAGLLVTAYAAVVVLVSVPLTVALRRIPRRLLMGGLLGLFTVSALASALAPTFEALVAARVVTAVAQAVFWSFVAATAVGRFRPELRGRVVAVLFTGSSLGPVLGLPAGTWIGQQAGWRAAFVAMAALALVTCAAVTLSLPTVRPEDEPARAGEAPHRRRYVLLLVVITLAIAGVFTAYTYVTAHLVDVAGLSAGAVSGVLLLTGLAGVVGAVVSGTVLSSRERASLLVPLAGLSAALWLLHLAGRGVPAAVASFALLAFAGAAFAAGLAGRVLLVAPGSTDLAAAGSGSAYNAGIGGGAWIGGLIVASAGGSPLFGGVHATALTAAVLATVALLLMLAEPVLAPTHPAVSDMPERP